MASKSKKRRRVLGASCILAALIIAGSSFAWFTSKDEVTNRLSANAGYDVSIVESFAPPENWLPGQQVNKDVYAVNTGNVDAFVEETVSGRLTITQEEATTSLTTESIKLNKAERYVVEAGAFLAYKPENSNAELGKKVVSMVPDSTNPDAYEALNEPLTDFTPDAPGLYVFRRSIGVDPDTRVEQYTYDGYYYTGGMDATIVQQQAKSDGNDGGTLGQYKWLKHKDDGSEADSYAFTNDQTAPTETGYTFTAVMENVPQQQVQGSAGTNHAGQYKWLKHKDGEEDSFVWTDDQTAPTETGYTFTAVMEDVIDQAGVPGGFYKISNLKVEYPGVTLAGDTNQTDGYIINPTYGFYEDKTKVIDPIDLKYDADNKRLVASYYTGKTVDYDTSNAGSLPNLATAYDNALIAYEDAVEEYKAAIRDQAASNGTLATQYNALQTALDNLQKAQNAEAKALENLTKAQEKAAADSAALGDPSDDSSKDTAYGRYKKAQEELTAAQQAYNDADLADQRAQADVDTAMVALYGHKDGSDDAIADPDPIVGAADHYTSVSKYGAWKAAYEARKARETTDEDAKHAFDRLFNSYVDTKYAANSSDTDVIDTNGDKVNLATVTYEQLKKMNLDRNDDAARYDYWELLVAEKKAEGELNTARANLADAQATKRTTANNKAKKLAALGQTTDDSSTDTAYGRFKKAQEELAAAQSASGSANSDLGDPNGTSTTGNNAWDKYRAAQAETAAKQALFDDARDNYTVAANAAGVDSEQVDEAEANLLAATQNLANAKMAYENAAPNGDGLLKININLSDKVTATPTSNDQWQLMPDYIGADKTAYFYYTGILGAGETSSKLIDSVELDSSVTEDMFKYFDFDLNVGLKSAQIAMANDGATILTTAADSTLDADATLATPTSIDTVITWAGEAPAAATSYTATATHSGSGAYADPVSITKLSTPAKVGDSNYVYKMTTTHGDFFGNQLTSGAEYVKGVATATPNEYTVGGSEKVTLDANAEPVATP